MAVPVEPLAGAWLVRARRRANGEKGATFRSNAHAIHGNVKGGVKEGRSRAEAKQERSSSHPPDTVRAWRAERRHARMDSEAVEGTSIASKPSPFARRRRTAV